MNILIIQDHLRIGGTERQSLFLARTFQQRGHRCSVLTFRPGGHLSDQRHLEGVHWIRLQRWDTKIAFWAPGLLKQVGRVNPDVVLCMGRTANCYAGFIQKRYPEIPVVGTLRTGKLLNPLHYWSLGKVRAVIANSNWWKRRLLEHDIAAERVHVVHNSLLLDRSEEDRQRARIEQRQQFRIPDNTCVFLNVATFRPGKRHLDLLRIFARFRQKHPDLQWRLWLVGDGKEYRRCKHWAAENGLGTRVRFFHFQHDPFPFYAGADVAVSVSREDSLPNFLIEAQATSLPVVAYSCRGVEETCLPGETGCILPPGDAEAFLQELIRQASDPEHRKAFAEGAPAFARNRFSRLPQAERTLEFLQNLVTERA